MYVITGASNGLGLSLSKLLVEKGHKVAGLSRSDAKTKGVVHISCNLTAEGSINQAAEQILAQKEPVQALVHCAGVFANQQLSELTGQEMARIYTTNIIGPMLLTARLIERIKLDSADIMTIDSSSALQTYDNEAAYGTSKWAMRGFSKNLQRDLKNTPCRVVNVCPSDFSEDQKDPAINTDDLAIFLLQILELPRNMEVREVVIYRK